MIPDNLFEKINEHTMGGFIIFYTGKEGDMEWVDYTDSVASSAGLLMLAKSAALAFESKVFQGQMTEEDGEEV